MKTIAHLLTLTLFVVTAACSKTDDNAPVANLSATAKQEIITDTWVISSYIDHSKNETSDYAGYSFTFTDTGELTATISGTTFTGIWSIGSDHSGFDDSGHHSGDDNKLIISITGNYQMDELSDDFQIVSISENEIMLKDDNLTKVKELRFTKK